MGDIYPLSPSHHFHLLCEEFPEIKEGLLQKCPIFSFSLAILPASRTAAQKLNIQTLTKATQNFLKPNKNEAMRNYSTSVFKESPLLKNIAETAM